MAQNFQQYQQPGVEPTPGQQVLSTLSQQQVTRVMTSDEKHKVTRGRYLTSNDPRGYIPVYEYPVNEQWIMLDSEDGYVLWTAIWKALGNAKADVVRMLDNMPELAPHIRRVRGGYLKIQGTWMRYEIAEDFARRVAYPIREDLIPLFGPNFPESCLTPDQPGYGNVLPGGRRRKNKSSQAARAARAMDGSAYNPAYAPQPGMPYPAPGPAGAPEGQPGYNSSERSSYRDEYYTEGLPPPPPPAGYPGAPGTSAAGAYAQGAYAYAPYGYYPAPPGAPGQPPMQYDPQLYAQAAQPYYAGVPATSTDGGPARTGASSKPGTRYQPYTVRPTAIPPQRYVPPAGDKLPPIVDYTKVGTPAKAGGSKASLSATAAKPTPTAAKPTENGASAGSASTASATAQDAAKPAAVPEASTGASATTEGANGSKRSFDHASGEQSPTVLPVSSARDDASK